MKKEKLVTRTMVSYKVTYMGLDVTTAEVKTGEAMLSSIFNTPELRLQAVKAEKESDTFKIAAITATEEIEKLYGMPESVFMKYATELPNRNNKAE